MILAGLTGLTKVVADLQVSHHPPISAAHAENEHFVYDITSKVKTNFVGNSVDVYPLGRWKFLDFAQLKCSSVSFFEVEKPETTISRWSRAKPLLQRKKAKLAA